MIENRCEVFFLPLYFLLKSLVFFLKKLDFWWEKEKYVTIATLEMLSNLYFIV